MTRRGLQKICMTYVKGLSTLYCSTKSPMNDSQKSQVLTTLKDFSSISKIGTLNNLFLTSFAELVEKKQSNAATPAEILLQIDVLIAILEKVRLKKENYLTLMQHVKVFADDRSTQKKAYKILAKVVERFELTGLDEITEIKETITPLMKGQASKDRVVLINSFINAVS